MPDFQDVSTVVSMVPVAINETKPGLIPPSYHIKAVVNPLTDCEILHVVRAKFAVYIDENRPALVVPEPSDRVAESICRDLKVSWGHFVPDVSEPALFWLPGSLKKDQVLKASNAEIIDMVERRRTMQMRWFEKIVAEADDLWGQHRARRMVSDLARAAARCLNLKRDWDIQIDIKAALSVCKFCRGEVNPEAIICKHCTGILDMERYKKEFVAADVKA